MRKTYKKYNAFSKAKALYGDRVISAFRDKENGVFVLILSK
jgi:hypothetical protein